MRKPKPKPAKPKGDPKTTIEAPRVKGKTDGEIMADVMLGHDVRHGQAASAFACGMLGPDAERPGIMDAAKFIDDRSKAAANGDLAFASHMLAAQATTLDVMFTELARRAQLNAGQYLNAAEQYGRLALKAQSNCRTTLEALAKLHQPREQTVKHVHVNEGGQAVVADHFHTGGRENAKSNDQSHATAAAGECAALPGPDPERDGVPIPSRQREAAMQDARRNESGAA